MGRRGSVFLILLLFSFSSVDIMSNFEDAAAIVSDFQATLSAAKLEAQRSTLKTHKASDVRGEFVCLKCGFPKGYCYCHESEAADKNVAAVDPGVRSLYRKVYADCGGDKIKICASLGLNFDAKDKYFASEEAFLAKFLGTK